MITFTEDFLHVIDVLENTDNSIFLTGKAGTGKSTLLSYFRENTKKDVVVLAPTGVAALNVSGQTIHSFFRFSPTVTLSSCAKKKPSASFQEMVQNIDTIIIDEVSMVRADLMDCIDVMLQKCKNTHASFGGIQMVFIGDLYQLPPIVSSKEEREMFKTEYKSPYFFDSYAFQDFPYTLYELEKVFRQKDSDFINLLNKIRNNSVQEADIKKLNTHIKEKPPSSLDTFFITLTTTNASADTINTSHLQSIHQESHWYKASITGEFDKKHFPTQETLELKPHAQIMFLNNDSQKRWVNGSIGKILRISENEDEEEVLEVEMNTGERVKVLPYTWNVSQYVFDTEKKQLQSQKIGSFTQYPVRLAWAITIHKSQGKTFENLIVDIGNGTFAHGQVYVALSRCTSFSGLILKKPILKKHIFMDRRIVEFFTSHKYELSEKNMSFEEKCKILRKAMKEKEFLEITYLKTDDTKSVRKIRPEFIGDMEYSGKTFFGMEAFCATRKDTRCFRIDRILKIS